MPGRGPRIVISRVLITAGAVCVLFAVGYEAAGYPWKILFAGPAELNVDNLPDPTPPNIDYVDASAEEPHETYDPAMSFEPSPSPSGSSDNATLPGQDDGYFNNGGAKPKPAVSYPPAVLLGAVKIPKIDISVNLVEEASGRNLLAGACHVPETPAIGQAGNVVVAGHRSTRAMHPFRHLDKIEAGDIVILKNDSHTYTYSAIEWFIVLNTETWVLSPVPDIPYCLTLVTCHPVGSARERLILRAELIDVDGMTPDEFYNQPEPTAPADEQAEDTI